MYRTCLGRCVEKSNPAAPSLRRSVRLVDRRNRLGIDRSSSLQMRKNWAKSAGYPRLDKPVRRLPYPEKRAAFAECLRPYPRCRESSAGFAASLLRFCFARSFKIILSLFRKRFALLSEYESRPISVPRLPLLWLYPNYAVRHIFAKTAVMLHKQHRCL